MLALVTSNPRFYRQLVSELESRGERFLSLKPGDVISEDVDIIITSEAEKNKINFQTVVSASTAAEAVREALLLRSGIGKTYNHLYIGIDPGKNIGIAAIGDHRLLFEDLLDSPENVWKVVADLKKRFDSPRFLLRIGSAGGAYRDRIIAGLQANLDCEIEIVSEEKTTGPRAESRRFGVSKDILSARKIALKKGRRLREKNSCFNNTWRDKKYSVGE